MARRLSWAVGGLMAVTSLLSCMGVGSAAPESARPSATPVPTVGSAVMDDPSDTPFRSPEAASPESAVPAPTVHAEPTRVVIRDLRIDLPVVRPARGEDYPLCDVAEFLPAYGLPGLPGVTYIYAHARAGMFLPLLEASRMADEAVLLGVGVDVYTADGYRRRYAIREVHRRVRTFDVVNDLRGDGLVLQTSETDHHTGTKLMVVARPVGDAELVSETKARPQARPRAC
jgi:hypothetical protein